jgi:hypothetical protein
MTKPRKPSSDVSADPVQFAEFWSLIANELGSSRLRIDSNAKTIHELVSQDSGARVYLRNAIKRSYKLSKCQHLRSPISLITVLDVLGQTAYELQGEKADDLFDIELLEEIAWHINNRYPTHFFTDGSTNSPAAAIAKSKALSAQVVSFPNYKTRRANTQS